MEEVDGWYFDFAKIGGMYITRDGAGILNPKEYLKSFIQSALNKAREEMAIDEIEAVKIAKAEERARVLSLIEEMKNDTRFGTLNQVIDMIIKTINE